MKLKLFGALLGCALVGCLLVGAGSASATMFCKKSTNPCTESYSLGTEWKFKLAAGANVTLKSPSVEASCTASEFGGLLEAQGLTTPAISKITTRSFSSCTELYPCPGAATLTALEPYEMQFTSKGSGGEGEEALWRRARIRLSAPCTDALQKCTYAAFNQKVYEKEGQTPAYEKGSVIWKITGGSTATKMTGFLGRVEGGVGCPPYIEIEGNFEIVKPVPLYLI
jgi:hypothetical protein